ncbi:unnamed protein product, partial [Mesorhabditis spiculigera]
MATSEAAPLIFPIVYTTALTIGSVSVTLFLTILIYGRKTFNEAPFYQIVYCLAVVDWVHLLQHWLQIFPQQIFGWGAFPFSEWLQDSVIGTFLIKGMGKWQLLVFWHGRDTQRARGPSLERRLAPSKRLELRASRVAGSLRLIED